MTSDDLARAFEAERPRLLRLAYATTGSWTDAEDCVQDAWLRLRRVDESAIENLQAWLTRVVGRLALDVLGSARVRRESYVGTWLPEPLVDADADPADRVTLDESVSMALLVVLERLSPAQRAAFVLHDVFGLPFDEVAEIVGRSPASVRQLASRARRDVAATRPRFTTSPTEHSSVLSAFMTACGEGDLPGLVALLDPDVVFHGDGGGKVPTVRAATRGADLVAKVLLGFLRKPPESLRIAEVNGAPGLVMRAGDGVLSVVSITVSDGQVTEIDIVRNPEKLTRVRESAASSSAREAPATPHSPD